ncbi:sulfate permease [Solwaraspora sp. WMMD937]|uniref:sulfate permease n=1 Tax=Solwaraspora sp. WMMD937 TaxID=3016090 RepID=UPI00249C202A|nr:sulfate permease [Solwaraspora sp. WMMD937]WFE20738.1 sulfate permease [Solwaraspora sp. WMMD937]
MTTTAYPRQERTGPARIVPILGWRGGYDRHVLRHDLIAGLTVAVMLVPQSMAYAALAGMPPVTGLYAAIVPVLVYALLGTSGSLAVGPVAITALMTATALAPLADGDPGRYAALAGLLAGLAGAIQVLMGVLRLGALVNFLSHSVLSGFTSAAALVIAASQVKDLLGMRVERAENLPGIIASLWQGVATIHPLTVAVAAASIAGLVLLRRYAPKVPAALLVVAAVTAVSAVLALGNRGVPILRDVPSGLPTPDLPALALADLRSLLPAAVAIALVAYMEGIAVAKSLAARSRQHVDPNAELVAVGAANAAAGAFHAFPVAGGFSRSAVNFSAGARTPVASVVTAGVVGLTALLLTPAFYHLPKAVLGAIVVVAVLGLVDYRGARTAWRLRRVDGFTLALTFAVTLVAGVEPGLAAGLVFSLAVFLRRSARPHTAELGRVPGTATFRNVARYQGLLTDPQVVVLRIDGPLYFANAQYLADRLLTLAETREALRAVVVDASAVGDADADGAHALAQARDRLASRGVVLRLATVRGPVRDLLTRSGLWPTMREAGQLHPEVADAVDAATGEGGATGGDGTADTGSTPSLPQEVY